MAAIHVGELRYNPLPIQSQFVIVPDDPAFGEPEMSKNEAIQSSRFFIFFSDPDRDTGWFAGALVVSLFGRRCGDATLPSTE